MTLLQPNGDLAMRSGRNAFIPTPIFWELPLTSTEDRTPYWIHRAALNPLGCGTAQSRDLWVPMSFTPVRRKSEGNNFDYSRLPA